MMGKFQKVDLAFNFLVDKENRQESFTLKELADATGWQISTCMTYPQKKWNNYVSRNEKNYTVSGLKNLSNDEFRKIHSQKNPQFIENAISINIKKAREFALLAASTYNNPFTDFKTYGFIVNIVIAYTAIFHAIFEKKKTSYHYIDHNGNPELIDGKNKTWELNKCCDAYWGDQNSPIKSNIKFLIGLRNAIEHRELPEIDILVFGECQAAINNFEDLMMTEFGDKNSLMKNLSLVMQLTRVSQKAQIEAHIRLKSKNFNFIKNFIEDFKKDLSSEVLESQEFRVRALLVPLVGKRASGSDIAIEFINVDNLSEEELEDYEKALAFIKISEDKCKLRPKRVVELIKETHKNFNISKHTKFWKYYNIHPSIKQENFKNQYCAYKEGFDWYLFNQQWVIKILETYANKEELKKVLPNEEI